MNIGYFAAKDGYQIMDSFVVNRFAVTNRAELVAVAADWYLCLTRARCGRMLFSTVVNGQPCIGRFCLG